MVDEKDLKIDVFSGGTWAKVSRVRVTHIPTGLSTVCEEHASWHANRLQAIENLSVLLAARTESPEPYIGDPGDESDHDRWEGEGGR